MSVNPDAALSLTWRRFAIGYRPNAIASISLRCTPNRESIMLLNRKIRTFEAGLLSFGVKDKSRCCDSP